MKLVFSLIALFLHMCLNAQVNIQWQHFSHLNTSNRALHIERLSDGNFVTTGHRFDSYFGNIPNECNSGDNRITLIKYKKDGTVLWERCLGVDDLSKEATLVETKNKGLLVSFYGAPGGTDDMRIYRLDSLGNILWSKFFGGRGHDRSHTVVKTSDDNYIITGTTNSPDGDLAGTGFHGAFDMFVLKIDDSGNILWKKCYGGSGFDEIWNGTILGTSVVEMPDKTLMIVGRTNSTNGDVTGGHGGYDAWLLKLSSTGSIIWKKCYGGTGNERFTSIVKSSDGLVIIGTTDSNNGDVVGNKGKEDIWIVKTDFNGIIKWQNTIGGSLDDFAGNIVGVQDGYVITGYSKSGNGDFYNNYGLEDALILKINLLGKIEWLKTFGGSDREWFQNVVKITENSFLVCGGTFSIDHDLKGIYRANSSWIIKFGESNNISGKVFLDADSNGIRSNSEIYLTNIPVIATKPNIPINSGFTDSAGSFSYTVDTGELRVAPGLIEEYYNFSPKVFTTNHTTFGHSDTVSFGVSPKKGIKDLGVFLIPTSAARAGFRATYEIICFNQGTEAIPNANAQLEFDSIMTFTDTNIPFDSIVKNKISWNLGSVQPFDTIKIRVAFKMPVPPVVQMGSTVWLYTSIKPVLQDTFPVNNFDTLCQLVTGPYDPNDKSEKHGNRLKFGKLIAGEHLSYFIRFQNVGNDTAFNVIVRDTLDARLDPSSMKMKIASHPYKLNIENGNILVWNFENIMLPDSLINEPASHGFIQYSIKPVGHIPLGDTIHNTASIYFDYNLPIKTNDAFTVVENDMVLLPVSLLNFSGSLSDRKVTLNWTISDMYQCNRTEIERSLNGRNFNLAGVINSTVNEKVQNFKFEENVSSLNSDKYFYRLKIYCKDGNYTYSEVLVLGTNETQNLKTYPNPAINHSFLVYKSNRAGKAKLTIFDSRGVFLTDQLNEISKGVNMIQLKGINKLANGSYYILLEHNGEVMYTRMHVLR